MLVKRVPLLGLLLVCGAAWLIPSIAQSPSDVYVIEPEDRAVVGSSVVFRLGVRVSDDEQLFRYKFRIVMSRDGFDSVAYSFDQVEDSSRWAYLHLLQDEDLGAMFRVPRPLEHGSYEWRVDVWTGTDWQEGDDVYRLEVDDIPPADVRGLEIGLDAERGEVHLKWDPVFTDAEGGVEYVSRYHVYRYTRRSLFLAAGPFEVGSTEDTSFVDRDEAAFNHPLVFYMVTAEDEVGNRPERNYRRSGRGAD